MSRRLRSDIPDGLYHVMNRGVLKCDIFINDNDRRIWLKLFHRVAMRCGWRVFSHVLMSNHFHIFLRLTSGNLSTGMHDLQSGYASVFNERHQREGTLFQGRFKSILVEDSGYAWTLSRYLHLNPCRARLVSMPEEYPWSTYRYYLNPDGAPEWLDWKTVLSEFSGTESAARIAYRRFVMQGISQPIENPFQKTYEGVLLGSPEFVARRRHLIEDEKPGVHQTRRSATIANVLAIVAQDFQIGIEEIKRRGRHSNIAREVVLWLTRETVKESITIVSAEFGISRAAVGHAIRRCEERQLQSEDLRTRCEALKDQVLNFAGENE